MFEREDLIRRSTPLEKAANIKLFENYKKPNNWKEMSDEALFEMLRDEVDELERDVRESYRSEVTPERLRREGGDIVNGIRFVLDKHGALDG